MKEHTHSSSTAGQAGAVVGRAWRSWLRQERRVTGWLVSKGLPVAAANALLWIVKLLTLGVLLYATFWLVLLLAFAMAAVWAIRNGDWEAEDRQPEWRNGVSGFGLYNQDGYRVDPHNFDDE